MGRPIKFSTTLIVLLVILIAIGGSWYGLEYKQKTNTPLVTSTTTPHGVMIGGQVWMTENEESIPSLGISSCDNNNLAQCQIKGRYYDWSGAMSICSAPWHLPSIAEWENMVDAVSSTVGYKNITSALSIGGVIGFNASAGSFWSSTQPPLAPEDAYNMDVDGWGWTVFSVQSNQTNSFNVRCVMDTSSTPEVLLSGPIPQTTSTPGPVGNQALSLRTMNSDTPVSWLQGSAILKLTGANITHADPEYQGPAIGELNQDFGINNNADLTVLNVGVNIQNIGSSSINVAFRLERVDEEGHLILPYRVSTEDNKPFSLAPNGSIDVKDSFVVSDADNSFLILAGDRPGVYFTVSRIVVNGVLRTVVQESPISEDDCVPMFFSDNLNAGLVFYKNACQAGD